MKSQQVFSSRFLFSKWPRRHNKVLLVALLISVTFSKVAILHRHTSDPPSFTAKDHAVRYPAMDPLCWVHQSLATLLDAFPHPSVWGTSRQRRVYRRGSRHRLPYVHLNPPPPPIGPFKDLLRAASWSFLICSPALCIFLSLQAMKMYQLHNLIHDIETNPGPPSGTQEAESDAWSYILHDVGITRIHAKRILHSVKNTGITLLTGEDPVVVGKSVEEIEEILRAQAITNNERYVEELARAIHQYCPRPSACSSSVDYQSQQSGFRRGQENTPNTSRATSYVASDPNDNDAFDSPREHNPSQLTTRVPPLRGIHKPWDVSVSEIVREAHEQCLPLVDKKLIVFIGTTRVGKSTLACALLDTPMKVCEIEEFDEELNETTTRLVVEPDGDVPETFPIGHEASKTRSVKYAEISNQCANNGWYLVDLPGFDDTSDNMFHLLSNALITSTVLQKAAEVKFLCLNSVPQLSSASSFARNGFQSLLRLGIEPEQIQRATLFAFRSECTDKPTNEDSYATGMKKLIDVLRQHTRVSNKSDFDCSDEDVRQNAALLQHVHSQAVKSYKSHTSRLPSNDWPNSTVGQPTGFATVANPCANHMILSFIKKQIEQLESVSCRDVVFQFPIRANEKVRQEIDTNNVELHPLVSTPQSACGGKGSLSKVEMILAKKAAQNIVLISSELLATFDIDWLDKAFEDIVAKLKDTCSKILEEILAAIRMKDIGRVLDHVTSKLTSYLRFNDEFWEPLLTCTDMPSEVSRELDTPRMLMLEQINDATAEQFEQQVVQQYDHSTPQRIEENFKIFKQVEENLFHIAENGNSTPTLPMATCACEKLKKRVEEEISYCRFPSMDGDLALLPMDIVNSLRHLSCWTSTHVIQPISSEALQTVIDEFNAAITQEACNLDNILRQEWNVPNGSTSNPAVERRLANFKIFTNCHSLAVELGCTIDSLQHHFHNATRSFHETDFGFDWDNFDTFRDAVLTIDKQFKIACSSTDEKLLSNVSKRKETVMNAVKTEAEAKCKTCFSIMDTLLGGKPCDSSQGIDDEGFVEQQFDRVSEVLMTIGKWSFADSVLSPSSPSIAFPSFKRLLNEAYNQLALSPKRTMCQYDCCTDECKHVPVGFTERWKCFNRFRKMIEDDSAGQIHHFPQNVIDEFKNISGRMSAFQKEIVTAVNGKADALKSSFVTYDPEKMTSNVEVLQQFKDSLPQLSRLNVIADADNAKQVLEHGKKMVRQYATGLEKRIQKADKDIAKLMDLVEREGRFLREIRDIPLLLSLRKLSDRMHSSLLHSIQYLQDKASETECSSPQFPLVYQNVVDAYNLLRAVQVETIVDSILATRIQTDANALGLTRERMRDSLRQCKKEVTEACSDVLTFSANTFLAKMGSFSLDNEQRNNIQKRLLYFINWGASHRTEDSGLRLLGEVASVVHSKDPCVATISKVLRPELERLCKSSKNAAEKSLAELKKELEKPLLDQSNFQRHLQVVRKESATYRRIQFGEDAGKLIEGCDQHIVTEHLAAGPTGVSKQQKNLTDEEAFVVYTNKVAILGSSMNEQVMSPYIYRCRTLLSDMVENICKDVRNSENFFDANEQLEFFRTAVLNKLNVHATLRESVLDAKEKLEKAGEDLEEREQLSADLLASSPSRAVDGISRGIYTMRGEDVLRKYVLKITQGICVPTTSRDLSFDRMIQATELNEALSKVHPRKTRILQGPIETVQSYFSRHQKKILESAVSGMNATINALDVSEESRYENLPSASFVETITFCKNAAAWVASSESLMNQLPVKEFVQCIERFWRCVEDDLEGCKNDIKNSTHNFNLRIMQRLLRSQWAKYSPEENDAFRQTHPLGKTFQEIQNVLQKEVSVKEKSVSFEVLVQQRKWNELVVSINNFAKMKSDWHPEISVKAVPTDTDFFKMIDDPLSNIKRIFSQPKPEWSKADPFLTEVRRILEELEKCPHLHSIAQEMRSRADHLLRPFHEFLHKYQLSLCNRDFNFIGDDDDELTQKDAEKKFQIFIDELTALCEIGGDTPNLQDNVDETITSILRSVQSNNDPQVIATIGFKLNSTPTGQQLVNRQQDIFVVASRELFKIRTNGGAKTPEEVIDDLKCVPELLDEAKSKLLSHLHSFAESMKLFKRALRSEPILTCNEYESWENRLRKACRKAADQAKKELSTSTVVELVNSTSKLFMLSSVDIENLVKGKAQFIEPHCTQIVTVFRLFALDTDVPSIGERMVKTLLNNVVGTRFDVRDKHEERLCRNHLAQILTGEGKSITLAILAAVWVQLGTKVDIACYSNYLTERDQRVMNRFLFSSLQLSEGDVRYMTLDALCGSVLKNLQQFVTSMLTNSSRTEPIRFDVSNEKDQRALVCDEVDVFFSPSFFGQLYRAGTTIKSPEARALVHEIFKNRNTSTYDVQASPAAATFLETMIPVARPLMRKLFQQLVNNSKNFDAGSNARLNKDASPPVYEYKRGDEYRSDIVVPNTTMFAYIHFANEGFITEREADDHVGIDISFIQFSFAEIPLHSYKNIVGVTGTLAAFDRRNVDKYEWVLSSEQRDILRDVFDISQFTFVPSMFPVTNKLTFNIGDHVSVARNRADWSHSICMDINQHQSKRSTDAGAVIVFFENLDALQSFKAKNVGRLSARILELHEQTPATTRDSIIRSAPSPGTVTFATRVFGRGTDFFLLDNVLFTVIQTFFSEDLSEEIQIQGRTARQGMKGKKLVHICAEDLRKDFCRRDATGDYPTLEEVNAILDEKEKEGALQKYLVSLREEKEKQHNNVRMQQYHVSKKVDMTSRKLLDDLQGAQTKADQAKMLCDACAPSTCVSKHFVLLLDCSHSMEGDPWKSLRVAYEHLIKTLKASDNNILITAIGFSGSATLLCEATCSMFNYKLEETPSGSSTNYEAAFKLAKERCDANHSRVPSLVMITDGEPNSSQHVQFLRESFTPNSNDARPLVIQAATFIFFGKSDVPPKLKELGTIFTDHSIPCTITQAHDGAELKEEMASTAQLMHKF